MPSDREAEFRELAVNAAAKNHRVWVTISLDAAKVQAAIARLAMTAAFPEHLGVERTGSWNY